MGPSESICDCCSRSKASTIISAFTMLVMICGQLRAVQKSHYAAERRRPWFAVPGVAEGFVGKYLLPLLDPYTALFLSSKTSGLASKMEKWLLQQQFKRASLNSKEDVSTAVKKLGTKLYDPRCVRVLIGAQVFLSVPEEDLIISEMDQYTYIKMEGDTNFMKYQPSYDNHDNPKLHIYPPSLLKTLLQQDDDSPAKSITFTFQSSALNIPLNYAAKKGLLELGFIPLYPELRQIKEKSTWEMVIVACNALGYLISIISRVINQQVNTIVSPVEALAGYIALLIVFQSVSEFMFGGSTPMFKHAVVVHLTHDQLRQLVSTVKEYNNNNNNRSRENHNGNSAISSGWIITTPCLHKLYKSLFVHLRYSIPKVVNVLLCVIVYLLVALLFILNHFYEKSTGKCKGCPWPILMVVFINFGIFLIVTILARVVKGKTAFSWIGGTWFGLASIITASAWALATIDTVKHWKDLEFHVEDSQKWYNTIIPHLR